MKRFILEELEEWKVSEYRKPLILRGARQVGKTWVMKEFGKSFKSVIYLNFEEKKTYKDFFKYSLDPFEIMNRLSMALNQKIDKDTLLIFDEIQECNDALNSLKYFCENAREYYVISACSLLGLSLANGFPVGKVDFIDMYPLTFSEFLIATGNENLYEFLNSIERIENIPEFFYQSLCEKLKIYLTVGGMPEAVDVWIKKQSIDSLDKVQKNILSAYETDFGKHLEGDFFKNDVNKIRLIWDTVASQLSKENKKFIYSQMKSGARAREYENSLQWLVNADLLKKIYKITKPGFPLKAYEEKNSFKLYHMDMGLLRRQVDLNHQVILEGDRLFQEFKGALTENFVVQSLIAKLKVNPHYWSNQNYEVDLIIELDNQIIPIEIKSGKNISSPSLNEYKKLYAGVTPFVVRYSLNNLKLDGNVLNIPLFLIDRTEQLIRIAQKSI